MEPVKAERRRGRRAMGVLGVVLVLAGMRWAWGAYWAEITPGEDTTRIGIVGEGTYVAELRRRFSVGVTGENNAAVLLVRALGPTVLPEARARASAMR